VESFAKWLRTLWRASAPRPRQPAAADATNA